MEKQNNYIFEIIFLPILIIIFLVISLTAYNINYTKKQLENQIKNKKIEFFETQKKLAYDKVQYLNNIIKNSNNKIKGKIEKELNERINIALKISKNIYAERKNLSKKDLINKLTKRLALLSYNNEENYYYILDNKYNVIHHPIKTLIGKNLNYIFDEDNLSISEKLKNSLKSSKIGFSQYYYYKPNNQKKKFLKTVVVTYFKPLDILIATGKYNDDLVDEIKDDLLLSIKENEEINKYVFISELYNINGGENFSKMLVNNNRKDLVGKVLSDDVKDSKGNYFRKEYLKILREKGEGFLKYWYKKPGTNEDKEKYTYFYLNKDWNWVLAWGFYPEDLEPMIKNLKEELDNYLETLIKNSLFWGLMFSMVMIFISTVIFYKIQRRIKQEQKRLIQSQENLKKAQKISKIGSWSYNYDTNEITFSDEIYEILEMDKNSVKPSYELFLSFVYSEDKNIVSSVFDKLIKEKIPQEIIHRLIVNNKIKWINSQSEMFVENNNTIVIGTIQDITEKYEKDKKIEEQAQLLFNQSKMAAMGEMIENIAHQWRQPLSAISTSASGLKLESEFELLNAKKLDEGLDNILNNTKYLSNTIEDFRMYFVRDKVKRRCNIKVIYENTIKLLKPKFDSLEIEIVEDCEDLYCTTLENELVQCFMNIFNNAYDALVKNNISKKLIFVSISSKYDNVVINITDNAGGIDKNIIQKVFEPYFTTKHRSQGTGIGLYMTQEIIIKHLGGFIKVKNEDIKFNGIKYKGANFMISLPLEIN